MKSNLSKMMPQVIILTQNSFKDQYCKYQQNSQFLSTLDMTILAINRKIETLAKMSSFCFLYIHELIE